MFGALEFARRLKAPARALCAATLLATALIAGDARADDGWNQRYDFGQGVDRLNRLAAPDPRRDFADDPRTGFMAGDDFGLGYDSRSDLLRLGPPAAVASRTTAYAFRFSDRLNQMLVECLGALDCDDGRFCNGAETCSALNTCAAGIPPLCSDGTACTTDSCSDVLGRCLFVEAPLAPVEGLALATVPGSGGSTQLTWIAHALADSYRVYLANSRDLNDLGCFASGIAGTTLIDALRPAPGSSGTYIIVAVGCGGREGSLGTSTTGVVRVPVLRCN